MRTAIYNTCPSLAELSKRTQLSKASSPKPLQSPGTFPQKERSYSGDAARVSSKHVDAPKRAGDNRALPMLRLDNVTKEYDLPPGQPGQLVAAETTTLKMICGLMLPTAGRITVNNIDVEQEPEEAQQYIG